MADEKTVRFRPAPGAPPKADWSRLDAMTDDETHAAALADADAQPLSDAQLAQMHRVPDVAAIRNKMGLGVEDFAKRFGLSSVLVREWEERRRRLDSAAKILLRVIEREPEAVARIAAE